VAVDMERELKKWPFHLMNGSGRLIMMLIPQNKVSKAGNITNPHYS
jgi:hypothetical protein